MTLQSSRCDLLSTEMQWRDATVSILETQLLSWWQGSVFGGLGFWGEDWKMSVLWRVLEWGNSYFTRHEITARPWLPGASICRHCTNFDFAGANPCHFMKSAYRMLNYLPLYWTGSRMEQTVQETITLKINNSIQGTFLGWCQLRDTTLSGEWLREKAGVKQLLLFIQEF